MSQVKRQSAEVESTMRDRAIDAAVRCFQLQGLSKSSMERVAREAKMSRATLYRHFDSREDLAIAVIEREAQRVAELVSQRIRSFEDIGDYIVEGILESYKAISANAILMSLLRPDSAVISSQLILMTHRLTAIGLAVMKPVIVPAQAEGVIRDDISPEMIMDWILRTLISMLTIPTESTKTKAKRRVILKAMLLPALLVR